MEFAEQVYALVADLPAVETYGMGIQLRKAAASVPSNIAEGYGRASQRDFANFLSIARGSLLEAETNLLLAHRLGYLRKENIDVPMRTGVEVEKMIIALRRRMAERLAQERENKRHEW